MTRLHTSRRLAWIGLLAAVLPWGAGAQTGNTLVVSAAVSLTQAFQAIGTAFEKTRPGVKVTFNFAASGPLLAQIQQGAPVDVFASADEDTMDRAAAARLLAEGSRVRFARNDLVLVVPANSSLPAPARVQDLAQPAYKRIAIGNAATVPAGRYAREALEAADKPLAATLEARFIPGDNVRQVLQYVARGEVDAGFVYRTDAQQEAGRVKVALTLPTPRPISYPMARVARSAQPELAQSFIQFVQTPAAQQLLTQHGFTQP